MTEPMIYIGYKKIRLNGETIMAIAVSPNSEDFTGEYHEITADYGKGSFGDLLIKLKGEIQNVK